MLRTMHCGAPEPSPWLSYWLGPGLKAAGTASSSPPPQPNGGNSLLECMDVAIKVRASTNFSFSIHVSKLSTACQLSTPRRWPEVRVKL